MSKKIFFSYGHDEYARYVEKVRVYLEEKGYSIFFDEDELRGTPDWEAKLEEGLKYNDKVVFFITPHSARRPDGYCLNELAMALTYKRQIIPVMLAYEVPPLSIVRQQYLDMKNCFTEDGLDEDLFTKHMENLLQVLEGNNELDFEGAQAKLFEELTPLDTTADFAKHKQIVGREWIVDEIDNWVEEYPDSKVLWITAEAGYGKSALSVYLANNHPDVAGIHFCNYNRPNTKDAKQVVKTLAYHLQARQLNGYFDAIKYVDTKDKNAVELFNELIANPLSRSQNDDEKNLFIVIDALDEALDDSEEELIELIGSYDFEIGLPDFVKIIVTSRPDPRLRQTLSRLKPIKLDTQEKKNEEDCIVFIKNRLELLKQNKYRIDKELIDKVMKDENFIKNIIDKSSANMLYLNKFFEEIEKRNIDLNKPDIFPKGLNGIYKSFFKRITIDEEKYDDVYAPILEVILAYGEPIPKLLLGDIMDLGLKPFNRAITNLGSVIIENDDTLDVYHKSIKDWLINEKENTKYLVDIRDGIKKINNFLDNICSQSYKEEYSSFMHLNIMFINRIYTRDNNIAYFIKLFHTFEIKRERPAFRIDSLMKYFNLHNKIKIAIELQEYSYKLLKEFYGANGGKFILDNDRLSWSNTLSVIYYQINNITPPSVLKSVDRHTIKKVQLLQNDIYKNASAKQSKIPSSTYTSIIQIENIYKERVDITNKLYKEDSERWLEIFLGEIITLALFYEGINRMEEAIELQENCVDIIKKLYEKDYEKYSKIYMERKIKLALIYNNTNQKEKAIEMQMENISISKRLYADNPKKWKNEYLDNMMDLSLSYQDITQEENVIDLQKNILVVLRDLCENNLDNYYEQHSQILSELIDFYVQNNQINNAINIIKENIYISKIFYEKKSTIWPENYMILLLNLSDLYLEINLLSQATNAIEEILRSVSHYNTVDNFRENYIELLNYIVEFYEKTKNLHKEKERKEELNILIKYEEKNDE